MYLCQHLMRMPVLRAIDLLHVHQLNSFHLCCAQLYPRQIRNQPDLLQQQKNTHYISPLPEKEHEPSYNDSEELNPVVLKCREILESLPEVRVEGNEIVEYVFRTKFGQVRFDMDNMPAECVPDDTFPRQLLTKPSSLNEIDEQYFKDIESEHIPNHFEPNQNIFSNDHKLSTLNEIDEQYFGGVNYEPCSLNKDKGDILVSTATPAAESKMNYDRQELLGHKTQLVTNHPPSKQDFNSETDLNYVDEVFFKDANVSEHLDETCTEPNRGSLSQSNLQATSSEIVDIVYDSKPLSDFERSLLDEEDEQCTFTPDPRHEMTPRSTLIGQGLVDTYKQATIKSKKIISVDSPIKCIEDIVVTPQGASASLGETDVVSASKEKLFNRQLQNNLKLGESTDTAFDYVLELRRRKKVEVLQEKAEDGSVFIPRYKQIIASVWNLEHRTHNEMTSMLKDCIIYDQYGVVALYKPYGLRMHGGGDSGGRQYTLTLQDFLPHLCRVMNADHLHHVHRLDVTTTGVLLLARTEEVAVRLRMMFQERKVVKNYLAITKSSPSILQGVIDIPLKTATVDGKQRMVLRPSAEGSNQRNQPGFRAVTKFKVLSRLDSAALVHAQPLTGVKHQIRAHLGLGLSCPVLADHKYSSFTKIVPQRLNSDVLHKLEMRQSRVRDLPMMLHASSIFLPQFIDGKNIKISCPPPPHFTKTMKALKLNSRNNVTDAQTLDFVDLGTELV